jgi:hypothetical protein
MQHSWASKSVKMAQKIYTLLIYEWYVSSTCDVLMWNTYNLHFN